MCANPGYGGNAPAEYVTYGYVTSSSGRTHEDARSVARSAPTRQPSLPYATLRTESGGGPSVVRALERRQRSRVLRLTRKAADVPDTVRHDPRARLAPRTQKRQHPDYDVPIPRDPPRDRRSPRSRRHHHSLPDPGDDAPRSPVGQGRHRPGQDRHRQDAGLRPPAPRARHRPRRRRGGPRGARVPDRRPAGPRRRPDARAVPAGHQRPPDRSARSATYASSRSTAAAPTSRRWRR